MAEVTYASNAKANTGVVLGSIALGTSLLGGLGGLLGVHTNANTDPNDKPITRYEYEMGQKLAAKDSEITLLKSEQNTEVKIADVYARLKGDLLTLERNQDAKNANQGIINQSITDNLGVINTQIAGINGTLGEITQIKVPNSAVCPGWGQVKVTPADNSGCGCNGSTNLY